MNLENLNRIFIFHFQSASPYQIFPRYLWTYWNLMICSGGEVNVQHEVNIPFTSCVLT